MKKNIQTKESIRAQMVEMFSTSIPSIKNSYTYPIIVMDNPTKEWDKLNIHWLWLLPSGQAITYGENAKNRFILYPEYKKPIIAANNDICEQVEIIPLYTNNPKEHLNLQATLLVKNLLYHCSNDNTTKEDKVVIITPAKETPAEISRLYYCTEECII